MDSRDQRHLKFIHDRLVNVHSENPNYDYMIRLREIIGDIPEPRPAPSNHPCVMKLKKEQYDAIKTIVIEAAAGKPTTATALLALDGIQQMAFTFGASSTDYITLYPTIG